MSTAEDVREALKEILDPEYPISLVDLGLIRGIEIEGSTAKIKLTYTCIGCPATDMIQDDIRDRLLRMERIEEVEIEEVWDSWSRENISKRGRIQLRNVGVV